MDDLGGTPILGNLQFNDWGTLYIYKYEPDQQKSRICISWNHGAPVCQNLKSIKGTWSCCSCKKKTSVCQCYGRHSSRMSLLWQSFFINNVLLVKIEVPVWYTIYHHGPVVKGVSSNPSINQPTNGNLGHLCSSFPDSLLASQPRNYHINPGIRTHSSGILPVISRQVTPFLEW